MNGPQTSSPWMNGETVMKAFILAAVAALSLGIGSAYAQTLVRYNQPQVTHWGTAYSSDVSGN
jgi:hypothetical protein